MGSSSTNEIGRNAEAAWLTRRTDQFHFAFTIQVGNGEVNVLREDGPTPDATIRTDPSAFGLVMTNRRPAGRYVEAGRWQAAGDITRADAFARAFTSY